MVTDDVKRAVVADAVSKGFESYADESLEYNYIEALGFLDWYTTHKEKKKPL